MEGRKRWSLVNFPKQTLQRTCSVVASQAGRGSRGISIISGACLGLHGEARVSGGQTGVGVSLGQAEYQRAVSVNL